MTNEEIVVHLGALARRDGCAGAVVYCDASTLSNPYWLRKLEPFHGDQISISATRMKNDRLRWEIKGVHVAVAHIGRMFSLTRVAR